jgi:hypothetical protein
MLVIYLVVTTDRNMLNLLHDLNLEDHSKLLIMYLHRTTSPISRVETAVSAGLCLRFTSTKIPLPYKELQMILAVLEFLIEITAILTLSVLCLHHARHISAQVCH